MTPNQLPLPLRLQDHAVFDSFHAVGNDALFGHLATMVDSGHGPGCFLWGRPATGKTHLLQAVCERAGDNAVYLPLQQLGDAGVAMLQGLAGRRFVCLDDLHSVVGNPAWEQALFSLYNELAEFGHTLVVSANAPPRECSIQLADLESRLSRLPVFRCEELPEAERVRALQLRARHRGLELPDDTANFLLARSKRDMASLYQMLDMLDARAMVAKRRLTIPFVREVLAQPGPDWPGRPIPDKN